MKHNLYIVYSSWKEDAVEVLGRLLVTCHFCLKTAHHCQGISEEKLPWQRQKFEIDWNPRGKKVFVVLVEYSTGDSFGKTEGCGYIEGVYQTHEEAEMVKEAIEDNTYCGPETWVPWIGFFESLEAVSIKEMRVEK